MAILLSEPDQDWEEKMKSHKCCNRFFRQSSATLVLDADALNVLSTKQELLKDIPRRTVITPHVKELERLFGTVANDFERMELALRQSTKLGITIVLKGAYSLVATPGGMAWFNSTGNPGMATGRQWW